MSNSLPPSPMRLSTLLCAAAAVAAAASGGEAAGVRERLAGSGFIAPAFYPQDKESEALVGEAKIDGAPDSYVAPGERVDQGEGAMENDLPGLSGSQIPEPRKQPGELLPFDKLLSGLPMSISPDTRVMAEALKLNALAQEVHDNNIAQTERLCAQGTCPETPNMVRPEVSRADAARDAEEIERVYQDAVQKRKREQEKAAAQTA